jgi:hypothetical protein
MLMKIRPFAVFVLLVTFGAPWLPAQNDNVPGTPARALITAEARHDGEPPTLTQNDVQVLEGKTHDQVTGLVQMQGPNAALDLLIMLDDGSSWSMSNQLQDIRAFIEHQPPTTAIAVGYMRNGTVDFTSPFTTDHAKAGGSLRIPLGQPGINGSPYFSLSEVAKNWKGTGAPRREVLMITSGIDPYGVGTGLDDPYVNAAISDAQKAGVVVFSIYTPAAGHFGHSFWHGTWGQNFLSQVADATGGES